MPQQPSRPIDDPLLARLDRLAQRRTGSQPFPPPRGGRVDGYPAGPPLLPDPPPREGSAPSRMTPTPRTRRRHPARGARIGALVVSCASTGALSYLFATSNGSDSQSTALAALPAPVATTSASTTGQTTTIPASATTTTATTAAQTAAFDGEVVNTKYGPIQVQVQITDGALSEVAVVQYPDGDRKSLRINEQALPTLRTEALTAQSADIDTVSGATYTSAGYAQSLQSALDAARAAGVAA